MGLATSWSPFYLFFKKKKKKTSPTLPKGAEIRQTKATVCTRAHGTGFEYFHQSGRYNHWLMFVAEADFWLHQYKYIIRIPSHHSLSASFEVCLIFGRPDRETTNVRYEPTSRASTLHAWKCILRYQPGLVLSFNSHRPKLLEFHSFRPFKRKNRYISKFLLVH
jgi:hypothetical protein